ncbi:MAG TPA: DUF302 domain-containing protein [Thermoanaerobaculaceae bacterium]|nr:DUF302 domain-containing protein [Thermoanaerobaculaceae bacterium]HPS80200.1 DUF302 domain-containing protein [Thermoanaerobaculaceae bacterium]
MRETAVAFEVASGLSFDGAVTRAREVLAAEGFGVITEIDVRATIKNKLGIEREPYLILGACHAPSAHLALAVAPDVGVLLPCNVTVSVEGGQTMVRAMRPDSVLGLLRLPELAPVGEHVGAALRRVVTACQAP